MENQVAKQLNSKKYSFLIYIIAAIIGLAAFLRSYPVDFISGRVGFYSGDHAQYISGYYAFRDSPWRLPLLWTDRLNYPEGISIGNTDSIPLAAILFKPFKSILPPDFHYFGLWYLISYLLQAIGAVFLIRQMGGMRWWHALLAACFALLVPAFIFHLGHTAFSTHAIELIGLGLYFQALKRYTATKPPTSWYIKWFILIGISFLIQPYLTAMVVPIYVAALLDMPPVRKSLRVLFISLIIPIITLVVVILLFWYMPGRSVGKPIFGYGVYSMNLLSPFVGGNVMGTDSLFLEMAEQRWDGYNYFGLGVMGVILIALWLQRSNFKPIFTKYRFLVLMLIAITIYALSNEVYIGHQLILKYPEWLMVVLRPFADLFRISGRFFWPVGYAILFASLFGVLLSDKKWAIWFIVVMLIAQVVDVPLLPSRNFVEQDAAVELDYPRQVWERLLVGKRELYLTPSWGCGGGWDIPTLQMLAAKNHVIVNTAYTARQAPNCKRKANNDRSNIEEGTVHVYSNAISQNQVENLIGPHAAEWCRRYTLGSVCVPSPNKKDLEILNDDNFIPFTAQNIQSFVANKLPGEIGTVDLAGRIALEGSDGPGFLVRGPNIRLPSGTYQYQLKYNSSQPSLAPIGRIEVYSGDPSVSLNQILLEQVQIFGSDGQEKILRDNLDIFGDLQSELLEIRVFWEGIGNLTVDQIVIFQMAK